MTKYIALFWQKRHHSCTENLPTAEHRKLSYIFQYQGIIICLLLPLLSQWSFGPSFSFFHYWRHLFHLYPIILSGLRMIDLCTTNFKPCNAPNINLLVGFFFTLSSAPKTRVSHNLKGARKGMVPSNNQIGHN